MNKIPDCVEGLLPQASIREGDIVEGETTSPIVGGHPVKFRGLVTSISDDGTIAIVKFAKPYDGCSCYLSRITALVSVLTKASDQNAINLRAALDSDP